MTTYEDYGVLNLFEELEAQARRPIFVVLNGFRELTLRQWIEPCALHRRAGRNFVKTSSAGMPGSSPLSMA